VWPGAGPDVFIFQESSMISRRSALSAASLITASALFLGLLACSSLTAKPQSVVDVMSSNPELSTLTDLLSKSGLAPVLSAVGPFTVFAPSNDAFKAVPAKTMEQLATNPAALKDVLSFHVVAGKLDAASITNTSVASVQGGKLALSKSGSFVTVEDAVVTKPDQTAANGVVHVIDRVLTPPKK
jgi:uncharacterized surface protein with fasciclin (FAS1) repeats